MISHCIPCNRATQGRGAPAAGFRGRGPVAFRSEILIKLDKKGRVLLPAAFRDELPADDRGAFVLYHSPNVPGVVNGNSRAGLRRHAGAPARRGARSQGFAEGRARRRGVRSGRLSLGRAPAPSPWSRTAASPCRPNSPRRSMPTTASCWSARATSSSSGIPSRWQARREAERDKMAAFVRNLGGGDA